LSGKIPERLAWAVQQLSPRRDDEVLEIGCGTGVAAELLCRRLTEGRLTAIDRSATMVAAARRRNRSCAAAGRAIIRRLALADADFTPASFDRALAVNVNLFWIDPGTELAVVRRVLRPGGLLCLVYQPPSALRGAAIAEACSSALQGAGFVRVRVATASSRPTLVSIRASTRSA
jgi:ubiquinone/menaquinone biosynthesis C-methylase UbiE